MNTLILQLTELLVSPPFFFFTILNVVPTGSRSDNHECV